MLISEDERAAGVRPRTLIFELFTICDADAGERVERRGERRRNNQRIAGRDLRGWKIRRDLTDQIHARLRLLNLAHQRGDGVRAIHHSVIEATPKTVIAKGEALRETRSPDVINARRKR